MNRRTVLLLALSCALSGMRVFSQQTAADSTNSAAATTTAPSSGTNPAPGSTAPAGNGAVTNGSPTAAPANAPAAARNIRFQFDGIAYSDVLERFAQMANKPLLSDTNIQGSLTFNDPTPYTYQEALDALNLILSMKDMALVET